MTDVTLFAVSQGEISSLSSHRFVLEYSREMALPVLFYVAFKVRPLLRARHSCSAAECSPLYMLSVSAMARLS